MTRTTMHLAWCGAQVTVTPCWTILGAIQIHQPTWHAFRNSTSRSSVSRTCRWAMPKVRHRLCWSYFIRGAKSDSTEKTACHKLRSSGGRREIRRDSGRAHYWAAGDSVDRGGRHSDGARRNGRPLDVHDPRAPNAERGD